MLVPCVQDQRAWGWTLSPAQVELQPWWKARDGLGLPTFSGVGAGVGWGLRVVSRGHSAGDKPFRGLSWKAGWLECRVWSGALPSGSHLGCSDPWDLRTGWAEGLSREKPGGGAELQLSPCSSHLGP